MDRHWTVSDPEHIQVKLDSLLEGISRSNPACVIFAAESTFGSASFRSLVPNVTWHRDQLAVLARAVWIQAPVLAARAQAGDEPAYTALTTAQDSPLLRHKQTELYQLALRHESRYDQASVLVIRALLQAAAAGDQAATKGAADLCYIEDFSLVSGNLVAILPNGMNERSLRTLVSHYIHHAARSGLPLLAPDPFGIR